MRLHHSNTVITWQCVCVWSIRTKTIYCGITVQNAWMQHLSLFPDDDCTLYHKTMESNSSFVSVKLCLIRRLVLKYSAKLPTHTHPYVYLSWIRILTWCTLSNIVVTQTNWFKSFLGQETRTHGYMYDYTRNTIKLHIHNTKGIRIYTLKINVNDSRTRMFWKQHTYYKHYR